HFNLAGLLANLSDGFIYADVLRNANVAAMHQGASFILRIGRSTAALAAVRGHDRDLHLLGLLQYLLSEIETGEPAPSMIGAAVQEDLGDTILARIVNQSLGSVFAMDDLRGNVKVLGKSQVALDGRPVFCRQSFGFPL